MFKIFFLSEICLLLPVPWKSFLDRLFERAFVPFVPRQFARLSGTSVAKLQTASGVTILVILPAVVVSSWISRGFRILSQRVKIFSTQSRIPSLEVRRAFIAFTSFKSSGRWCSSSAFLTSMVCSTWWAYLGHLLSADRSPRMLRLVMEQVEPKLQQAIPTCASSLLLQDLT